MRKKILIDANPVVPYFAIGRTNGIGRTCMDLITELDSMRQELPFDIELYTQNIKGVTAKELKTGFKSHHLYFRHDVKWNKWVRRLYLREMLARYDFQHITHNYEIVTDPSKCIVTVHDAMFFSYPEDQFDTTGDRERIPPFINKAAAVITISENSKREIMEYMNVPEERITVIPWGVNHNMFYPHRVGSNIWSGNAPYFIAVSCDIGRKNTISIVRAFERFAQMTPSHHLILVWRNPSPEVLKITELPHLKGKIHFASNISNEALADLYAGATASFFPSLYEGFGLPIIESMACGVPCITCRNSSLEEVGGTAAIYVEPLDIDAMAQEMEKFENNDYDYASLRESSINQAAKFTWQKCAEKTVEVYRSCLNY